MGAGTRGITGFGGYVPRARLDRAAIVAAHGWMAPGLKSLSNGCRALAGWDEDVLTMAVEAGRDALTGRTREGIRALQLASTNLPFSDHQNASIVAGALDLPASLRTLDIGHSQRASTSGLLAALESVVGPTLFIASDMPRAKPASTQELSYGAGAAAIAVGDESVLAALIGSASVSAHFVDHFRPEKGNFDYYWEDRWIRDEGYQKLVPPTVARALAAAGLSAVDVDRLVMAAPSPDIAKSIARSIGVPLTNVTDSLAECCGYAGSAHALLMLAHALEKSAPNQTILWIGFGQGCDAIVFRVTDEVRGFQPRRGVSRLIEDRIIYQDYMRLLSYRGDVDLDWGMRAERSLKTALSEQYRSRDQLLRFAAGRCAACGTVQFPQLPYCVDPSCNAPAVQFVQAPLYDEPARVASFIVDWLSFHPAPPLITGQIQFDNGAKLQMEIVDVPATGIAVGTPVRMAFRLKDVDKARGYPRYFWKATSLATA